MFLRACTQTHKPKKQVPTTKKCQNIDFEERKHYLRAYPKLYNLHCTYNQERFGCMYTIFWQLASIVNLNGLRFFCLFLGHNQV